MMRGGHALLILTCLMGCDGDLQAFRPLVADVATGGSAGSTPAPRGGEGGEVTSVDPTTPLSIDDFEDGDTRAEAPFGWWYPVNDGTGIQGHGIEPATSGTGSVYSAHTHGRDFGEWGAAFGVNFVGVAPLDATAYSALCFRALMAAPSTGAVGVHLLRGETHFNQTVPLTATWTRYCLPLAEFRGDDDQPLLPRDLAALQFFFAVDAPFDFWLDDVELVP